FVCETEAQCPDEWLCGPDGRCYPAPLECYPHVGVGCAVGQGCYVSTVSGPFCDVAGPLGQYAQGCDNSNLSLRCGAGMACVSFGEDTLDDNFCLRYCRSDGDCAAGDRCDVDLVVTDGIASTLGDDYRVCAPPVD
ncbi:MAG: hypothetical protein H6724_06145, partial [Sandaracinus sp.]|nr:hypothetical protein [Sandaracinus sp.]